MGSACFLPSVSVVYGCAGEVRLWEETTFLLQASLVQRALETADWNVAAAARNLDLTRAHLYNLIKGFGLSRRAAE